VYCELFQQIASDVLELSKYPLGWGKELPRYFLLQQPQMLGSAVQPRLTIK